MTQLHCNYLNITPLLSYYQTFTPSLICYYHSITQPITLQLPDITHYCLVSSQILQHYHPIITVLQSKVLPMFSSGV